MITTVLVLAVLAIAAATAWVITAPDRAWQRQLDQWRPPRDPWAPLVPPVNDEALDRAIEKWEKEDRRG